MYTTVYKHAHSPQTREYVFNTWYGRHVLGMAKVSCVPHHIYTLSRIYVKSLNTPYMLVVRDYRPIQATDVEWLNSNSCTDWCLSTYMFSALFVEQLDQKSDFSDTSENAGILSMCNIGVLFCIQQLDFWFLETILKSPFFDLTSQKLTLKFMFSKTHFWFP